MQDSKTIHAVFLRCLAVLGIMAACNHFAKGTEAELRSAFLGPDRWKLGITAPAVNRELKAHFAQVLDQLEVNTERSLEAAIRRLERESSGDWLEARAEWSVKLRAARSLQIERLREYAAAGRFPINEGQAPHAVPIFVDQNGTHCAVGQLMRLDGRDKAIRKIVESNNLVLVDDVQSGGLVDWVKTSGLTQEEAAVIQPAYPPLLQVTLQEMQTTTPTLVREGYTVSNLKVTEVSYAAGESLSAWAVGLGLIDSGDPRVVSYRDPDEFGLVLASVEYETEFGFTNVWANELNSWLYYGKSSFSFLGEPVDPASNNAIMFKMEYDIQSNTGPITDVSITADYDLAWSGTGAGAGPQADLRARSIFYDVNNQVVADLDRYSADDVHLAGHTLGNTYHQQLRVETYAMAFDGAVFNALINEFRSVNGDFDNNRFYEAADIDALMLEISTGNDSAAFDLNGDGSVDLADRDVWLGYAGPALGFGGAIVVGDANLDGIVDVADFNVFNSNKFTVSTDWSKGEFNGDGTIDVADFNHWNQNKFTSSDLATVPEPNVVVLLLLGGWMFIPRMYWRNGSLSYVQH